MRRLFALLFLCAAAALAQEQPASSRLQFRWDLLLRYDEVNDFPRRAIPGVDTISFDRTRMQIRPGILFTPSPMVTFEGRAAIHDGELGNEDFPLGDGSTRIIRPHDHFTFTGRQDNFRPESVVLDRLNVQLRPSDRTMLVVGKFENPFDTTEAMWDSDLQPEGVGGSVDFGSADAFHSRVTAGAFFGTQLYGDESTIGALQYTLATSETAPVTFSASLGYFGFDDLDVLARRNWRQNETVVVDGVRKFASDFEIGHALLRLGSDRLGAPMELHYEHMHNFGARFSGNQSGFEAGLRVGPLPLPGALRFSYIFQDLDRDSVMAGFNGDDWYLHSWYRGSLYRLQATVWRDFGLQATFVDLEHHEVGFNTTRWTFDLVKRY